MDDIEVDGLRRLVNSCYQRTVRAMGGNEDRGVNLPVEWRREHGVEKGDEIMLQKTEDGALKILPPESPGEEFGTSD